MLLPENMCIFCASQASVVIKHANLQSMLIYKHKKEDLCHRLELAPTLHPHLKTLTTSPNSPQNLIARRNPTSKAHLCCDLYLKPSPPFLALNSEPHCHQ